MRVVLVGPGDISSVPFHERECQIWRYDSDRALPRMTLRFNGPRTYIDSHGMSEFPHKRLVDEFGPYWFTSTLAWLIAFAILAGAKAIELYGTSVSSEQLPAIHHWMWVCARLHITVFVQDGGNLLDPPPLYGIS